MRTTVRKWGNSLALRLPRSVAREMQVEDGAVVSLTVEDDVLTVKPARKRYRLEDLLRGLAPDTRRGETDWGGAEGKEGW